MAVTRLQPGSGRGYVPEQPLTMREGDHEVKITLPDCNWDGDFRRFEAPVVAEHHVIVDPAIPAVGEAAAHTSRPDGCEKIGRASCRERV
mgnify:CR=1 FL=1